MTERVRTVRSGIVGLDLALGGGFRFVRRTHQQDRESASILIRGGPGAGKSVLAEDLALRLASALHGDALYVCIEVLPSEILTQRMGFEGFDARHVVDLSEPGKRDPTAPGPCLVLGVRDPSIREDGVPDLGAAMLDLAKVATERGYAPKVVVIDSLSDGYNLGHSVPRPMVDGICKLAIQQGWALILIEEIADDSLSPWTFAVDTALSLEVASSEPNIQARRELVITKHRFASCEPGPHRLLIEHERVRVIPPFSAYRNAVRDLTLPPSASDRSLRVPTIGTPPDWEEFRVPDGEGRCIMVTGNVDPEQSIDTESMEALTTRIGNTSAAGEPTSAGKITFHLAEKHNSLTSSHDEFRVGTLHQFADGEEWLEGVLTSLAQWSGDVARIRIGPFQRLEAHEHRDELTHAISLLLSILERRGFIAVLYGEGYASKIVREGIVTNRWYAMATKSPAEKGERALAITWRRDGATFLAKLD